MKIQKLGLFRQETCRSVNRNCNPEQILDHNCIYDDATELIGDTPIVRLSRLFPQHDVLAKLEGFNPVGSIKDRPACYMIKSALKRGEVTSKTVVVESSSGNLGLALAFICKFYNLRFVAVVDPKISKTNLQLLKLHGAEIEMVREPDAKGNYLSKRIERVKDICQKIPQSFWPCQYGSQDNPNAHYYGTGEEIVTQLNGSPLDYFLAATSTTGTITGVSRRLKEVYPGLTVTAVDEEGSSLFGGQPGPRFLNGMGAGHPLPDLAVKAHQQEIADYVIRVTAEEAIKACYDLLESEGIMAGGSGGAVIAALQKYLPTFPSGSSILIILPDRGERYLQSFYDEEWVAQKLSPLTLVA
jgi:cysteine synthase A